MRLIEIIIIHSPTMRVSKLESAAAKAINGEIGWYTSRLNFD